MPRHPRSDDRALIVDLLEPDGAVFEVVSTDAPTPEERSNKGTSMLATRAKPGEDGRVAVRIAMRLSE